MVESKVKKWAMTINSDKDGKLVPLRELVEWMTKNCSKYIFREEVGEKSGRHHYQCAMIMKVAKRKSTLLNSLKEGLTTPITCCRVSIMSASFESNVEYCVKTETGVGLPIGNIPYYDGMDISFLDNVDKRYPWQSKLMGILLLEGCTTFKTPDDRKIYWITDPVGNCGKSKFVKFMFIRCRNCIKVPFGSASQLRRALIDSGPQTCYFIDIPRTLGLDDDLFAILSVIEDLKNGFIVSSMYGKSSQLVMQPPHVVVFTNKPCPYNALSGDRWIEFQITKNKELVSSTQQYTAPL